MLRIVLLAFFLSLAATPTLAADSDPVARALQQAEGSVNKMLESAPEQNPQGDGQEQENSGPEQAIYPGVRNRRLQSGGAGEPSSSIWYPQFGHAEVDAALRNFVSEAATGYEDECRASIGEDGQKPESWSQWEQSGFFTLTRPNPNVVSVVFNIYSYTGGAHGQIFIVVFNYDLKTGQRLELKDLFGNVPEALRILSNVCVTQLRKTLGEDTDEDMLSDGTEPTEANFANLSLLPAAVAVEFQPYQVGPWSIGQQRVEVPLADLAPAGPSTRIWSEHN